MEDENESLIDESGDEGTWFHFRGKAEFRIKRIGGRRRRALIRQYLGKKAGAPDLDRALEFQLALGCEALLDSRKVQVLGRYLEGTPLANGTGEVLLDGKWSNDVKKAVLSEVPGVLKFVVAKADSLDAEADEEESGKE